MKDRDAGTRIEAETRLLDGRRIEGPADLRKALLARPDQFVQALTEKLLIFALGRNVEYPDMPLVRAITRDAAKNGYRFESIVQGIVASDAFQKERVPSQPAPATTTAANLRE